jgi:hypothetical protein
LKVTITKYWYMFCFYMLLALPSYSFKYLKERGTTDYVSVIFKNKDILGESVISFSNLTPLADQGGLGAP